MNKLTSFFTCLLKDDCEYSIKKFLVFVFTIIVAYIIIATDKNYYEILLFIAALLGIRSYERLKSKNPNDQERG